MDREALVNRNLQMAQAFHNPPVRHQVRHALLQSVATFPFAPLNKGWNRILFIKPDHLGDMLLATPALRALKAARPYTEIHVLAGPWAAPVLANCSAIDLVLTIPFPGFMRNSESRGVVDPYTQLVRVSRQLRRIGYGSAVILRPDHWWGAMLAKVAGINERIGYALEDVVPFLTDAVPHRHEHVVRQSLRLVEQWTGVIPDDEIEYFFEVFDDEREQIEQYLAEQCGIGTQDRIFCIHPGSGTWVKQWSEEQWAQTADTLVEQLDSQVIFTGGDDERALVARIQNRMKLKSFTAAGELSLSQLGALYERALVVLGPDSGPLHLAAAVRTPTVTLFGPADPVEFGPWGTRNRHIILSAPIGCRPCRVLDWGDDDPAYHPCVREIHIGQVLEAARRVVQA